MRRCGTMPTMLMYPQIDPVALQIGPLAVHWYGLTYLAAFGLFLWLGTRRLRHPPFVRMQGDRAWTRKDVEDILFLGDRKSTRLNSSHLVISYAVFCLKK